MAAIIRLFKSKKSRKDEETTSDDLAREVSNRRSFRAPNSSSSSKHRHVARFADDGALSATAAYHTSNPTKFRKGPQSCPGGYREESDVSYESDKYSQKSSNNHRRRDPLAQSMRQNYTIDEGGSRKTSSRRHHNSRGDFRPRRGESSEYGSGDPSPVGHFSSRHSHYEDRHEESENDDFSEKAQFAVIERAQQHWMQKYRESEQKKREERKKFKEMEKECNEAKNSMFHYMHQLEKVKKERDCYRKELTRCKKQLELMQQQHQQQQQQQHQQNNVFDSSFAHHMRPSLVPSQSQQFQQALNVAPYNFMQPMSTSLHHSSNFMMSAPPSSNTPVTMNSGGAGESLTNPSDLSYLQSSFPSQVLSGITPSPNFKVPANFGDEERDEVKDFRSELTIETARAARRKTSDDRISLSPSSSADSQVTLLDQTLVHDKENRVPPTRPFSMMSI